MSPIGTPSFSLRSRPKCQATAEKPRALPFSDGELLGIESRQIICVVAPGTAASSADKIEQANLRPIGIRQFIGCSRRTRSVNSLRLAWRGGSVTFHLPPRPEVVFVVLPSNVTATGWFGFAVPQTGRSRPA